MSDNGGANMRIDYSSFVRRAKLQKDDVILFRRSPATVHTTVSDVELGNLLAEALAYLAASYSEKSNGRKTPEEVLVSLLDHCTVRSAEALPEMITQVSREKEMGALRQISVADKK